MTALADLVRPELVRIMHGAADAESVIRELAGALVEAGLAHPSLPDAAVARERSHPTGLLLSETGPDAALPHADSEHVITAAVAVATLAVPVDFRRMDAPDEPVPVRLVILLGLADPEGQLSALREVGAMLQDPRRVASVLAAPDAAGVIAALDPEAP